MKKMCVSILLLSLVITAATSAFAEMKMGIFPRRNVAATSSAFKPLADHLSEILGERVTLVVPKNFEAFWEGVEQQSFDIVHFNQYHYILGHEKYGYKVLVANEEFGKKTITGSLAVRKDSGITSVADLKGKKVLFGGGKKAMASYIAPTAVLKQNGLLPGRDYTELFAKNPPGAALGTFNQAAECAGMGDVVLRLPIVTQRIDTDQMVILAQSDSFVHLPWAVKADLPQSKFKLIRNAMVSLGESESGREILSSAKVTGFYPVDDNDFDKVREIVDMVEKH